LLRHDDGVTLPETPSIQLYPNPVAANGVLNIQVDRTCTMQVLSVLGQSVTDPIALRPYQVQAFSPARLSAGLYLMKFTVGGKSYTHRFVVH